MRWILTLVMLVAMSSPAAAQMVPPPMIEEPKMLIGVSGTVWVPQGDADDFADTSIGLRPHFSYRVKPFVAVLATFDYIFVNEIDSVDITYYSVNVGARFIKPRPGLVEPYGELVLGLHQFEADGFDDSGIGFRLGGGVLYPFGQKLVANLGINYSSVSIDAGLGDVDVNALIFEIGVGFKL